MELDDIKKPKLYSVKEVARFMEISVPTLYRLIKNAKIKVSCVPGYGLKGKIMFRAADVQEYYDSILHPDRRLEDIHK